MTRRPDWEQRLHELIEANFTRPHVYGEWDCMLFAPGAAVEAVTGTDHGAKHRSKYKSPASAVRYLKSIGFNSPEEWVDAHFPEKPIGFAQHGDLVLVPGDALPGGEDGWAIPGVCIGSDALVIGNDGAREGLFRVPRSQWLKAWAV